MVSQRLEDYVRREFRPADAGDVLARLDTLELANAEKQSLERIQAAVLLLTRGEIDRLEESVRIAERDWRDALVWSGLGHGDWPQQLESRFRGDDQ
jgi:hypothetical protein